MTTTIEREDVGTNSDVISLEAVIINVLEDTDFLISYLESVDGVVGHRCTPNSCPLVEYIRKCVEVYGVEISDTEVNIWYRPPIVGTSPALTIPLPLVAQYFIEEIDGLSTPEATVTSEEAIRAAMVAQDRANMRGV